MDNRLKELLENKGFSQVRMAEMLGVSVPYVNAVLTGTKALGKKNAKKWANLFGLSETYLLTRMGDPEENSNNNITVPAENMPKEHTDVKDILIKTQQDYIKTLNSILVDKEAKIAELESELQFLKYRADRPSERYPEVKETDFKVNESDNK